MVPASAWVQQGQSLILWAKPFALPNLFTLESNRHHVQTAIPFLIGTKFDTFATFPRDEQEEVTKQVRLANAQIFIPQDSLVTLRQNVLRKRCMPH